MNRCYASPNTFLRRRPLLTAWIVLPLLLAATLVHAQTPVRPFPPKAMRGSMVVTYPPIIQMDGKQDRLSPGSRIRGTNNMLVLSGSIVGQKLVVNYVREPMGLVHEVWILTPEEAALKLPTQK